MVVLIRTNFMNHIFIAFKILHRYMIKATCINIRRSNVD